MENAVDMTALVFKKCRLVEFMPEYCRHFPALASPKIFRSPPSNGRGLPIRVGDQNSLNGGHSTRPD
jgi:hypothetical protein